MNLNDLDNELELKIIEVFKMILKKQETKILFNQETTSIYKELTTISFDNHFFSLYSHNEEILINEMNYNFYKILPKKIKNNHINLTDNELINKVVSKRFYKLLIPILGNIYEEKRFNIEKHKINYNNIIIELDKLNYDKLLFYTKNVYKLQQLYKLNEELNIEQQFNIVFEEEKIKNDLYSNFYIKFKDIIKPPN